MSDYTIENAEERFSAAGIESTQLTAWKGHSRADMTSQYVTCENMVTALKKASTKWWRGLLAFHVYK